MRASHMAIRRHTLEIGRELEAQRLDAAYGQSPRNPDVAESFVVGIDDTYVKHRERLTARQFQVTAGRVERNGKLGARFVFVSSNLSWSASLFDGFLLQQGMKSTLANLQGQSTYHVISCNTYLQLRTNGSRGIQQLIYLRCSGCQYSTSWSDRPAVTAQAQSRSRSIPR
jgi:hypothetical protein